MDRDRIRAVNPIVKKKHIQILEEVERLRKKNETEHGQKIVAGPNDYFDGPSDYFIGQNDILDDLIIFINKL